MRISSKKLQPYLWLHACSNLLFKQQVANSALLMSSFYPLKFAFVHHLLQNSHQLSDALINFISVKVFEYLAITRGMQGFFTFFKRLSPIHIKQSHFNYIRALACCIACNNSAPPLLHYYHCQISTYRGNFEHIVALLRQQQSTQLISTSNQTTLAVYQTFATRRMKSPIHPIALPFIKI